MENKMREEVSAAVALATLGVRTSNQLMPHPHQHLQQHLQQVDMRRMMAGNNNSQLQAFTTQTPESSRSMATTKNAKSKKRNFAQKLFDVLDSGYHSDVAKWLPGGKAFIVLNKRRFANEILPVYFKQSQYTSFTRKLSRWKFTRVSRGPYIGAYYHRRFRANNMKLCETMSCNDSKKLSKSGDDQENEDNSDHEELAEIAALEALEETSVTIPSAAPTPPVVLSATALPRPASSERTNGNFGQSLMLRNMHDNIYNTNNNILLIKEQLMEIRLRKARVHKRKQLLLMQAEAERLKKIQMLKNAVTASIQQSESRIIAAAARALDRNSNIHRSLLQNQIHPPSSQWQSLPWLTQDAAIRALHSHQHQDNAKQTESNGMNPRAYAA
jgi:hypothetical protein